MTNLEQARSTMIAVNLPDQTPMLRLWQRVEDTFSNLMGSYIFNNIDIYVDEARQQD